MKILILLYIFNFHMKVNADVGGHDLFTSLAQLEVLWKNELEVIKVMEVAITKMEKGIKILKE